MDGVLSDYEAGYNLLYPNADINNKPELDKNKETFAKNKFFETLPVIQPGFKLLLDCYNLGFDVEILTAVGDNDLEENTRQKFIWIQQNVPFNIKFNAVKKAKDKAIYANENTLLIDDRIKSITPFEQAGGKCYFFTLNSKIEDLFLQFKI